MRYEPAYESLLNRRLSSASYYYKWSGCRQRINSILAVREMTITCFDSVCFRLGVSRPIM